MSLAAGKTVLGRFQLVRELPGGGDLWRWEARDAASGETVEVVAPRPHAALRPGAAARFAAAQRLPEHAAIVAPLASGLEGDLPVAARPLTQGPPGEPLAMSPDEALAALAWLAPAVQAGASALGEGLGPDDLAIDAQGVLRLAPDGVVEAVTVGRPSVHRAPEIPPGATTTAAGALYGLGVWAFRAATGAVPVQASSDVDLRARQAQPLLAATARPDLPPELASALDGLVSPDPARRLAAAAALPPPVPARLSPKRAPARAAAPPRPATPARPPAARDLPLPEWALVVAPGSLNLAQRRRAAALAELPTAALIQPQGGAGWVPVGGAETEAAARAQAAELSAGGLPVQVLRTGWPMGRVTVASLSFALGAIALAFALVIPFALILAVPALMLGLFLAASAIGTITRGARARAGRRAAAAAGERVRAAGPLGALAGRLSETRRALLAADLPAPVRVDLGGALDEVEDRADALAGLQGAPADEVAALTAVVDEIDEALRAPATSEPSDVARIARDVARARAAWAARS